MPTLESILEPLRAALKAKDYRTAGEKMCEFAERRGEKWLTSAGLEGVLPRTTSTNFLQELVPVLEVLKHQISSDDPDWQSTAAFVGGASVVNERMAAVRDALAAPDESSRTSDEIVFEFATWVEVQSRLAIQAIMEQAQQSGSMDMRMFQADVLKTTGGNPLSSAAIHETAAENLQLISAHFQCPVNSPRADIRAVGDDFTVTTKRLTLLASAWRAFDEIYDRMIFEAWRVLIAEDRVIVIPSDWAEARRRKVGEIRRADQLATAGAFGLRRADVAAFNKAVKSAAGSLKIAADAVEWSCDEVDVRDLRTVIELDPSINTDDPLIDVFLYGGVAAELVIPAAPPIAWGEIYRAMRVLRALAAIIGEVVTRGGVQLPRPVVTSSQGLARLIANATPLLEEQAVAVVKLLTFTPRHRELELWDSPLIQVSGDRVILTPSLIMNASGVRRLENMTAQWMPQLFDRRGKNLEDIVFQMFARVGIPVQRGFEVAGVEFDLMVFWSGWLFLFEAKCTKSVFSPRDAHRARSRAGEAVEQLNRRKLLVEQWDALRKAAHVLELPPSPPPPERIVLIAVMNVPHLTTAVYDGVLVTDEMCIQRYLTDSEIEVLSDGVKVGTLGDVRGEMSPEGFVEYLKRPPQVAYVDEALHPEILVLPSIGKELPTLLWTLAYTPKVPSTN